MISVSTRQQAIIDTTVKIVYWLFKVTDSNGTIYHWSTKSVSAGEPIVWDSTGPIEWGYQEDWDNEEEGAHTFKIIDFSGVEFQRSKSESAIQAPSDLTFSISNSNNTLTYSDFVSGTVQLTLRVDDGSGVENIRQWKFRIKKAEPGYQKIKITCEDFLQQYLRGSYPNTRLVKDIFYSSDVDEDDVCVPEPFGTCYIPLRSVYISDAITLTAITLSAVASAGGANCAFQDSGNGLSIFFKGWYITTTGFTDPANNGTFKILSVAAGEIQVASDAGLVTEAAGDSVTITQSTRYYLLGDPSLTYTITEVRSPREWGGKSVWTSADGYSFTQSSEADGDAVSWRVFQAIVADSDEDGTADANGLWKQGDKFLDMPTKFSRSDTSSFTNPASVIREVLKDFSIPAADIDEESFLTAAATFTSWGLTFNGAFWHKEDRGKVLSQLLNQCHSTLIVGGKIELKVLVKASQKTITKAEILKTNEVGEGTFRYTDTSREDLSDSGYIAWQESGEAQDKFIKTIVPAKSTKTKISNETLEIPFVQNSIHVQNLGSLYFQRKLLSYANVNFTAKATCILLEPDDVITINHADYGGSYDVLIDSVKINHDLSIDFNCIKFSQALDDWGDLSFSTITVNDDDGENVAWSLPVTGPDGAVTSGDIPNVIPGRLKVGDNTNYILFDPENSKQDIVNSGTVKVRLGNINGFLSETTDKYGFAAGDANSYIKWDGSTLSIQIASDEAVNLYGNINIYTGGDITLSQGGLIRNDARSTVFELNQELGLITKGSGINLVKSESGYPSYKPAEIRWFHEYSFMEVIVTTKADGGGEDPTTQFYSDSFKTNIEGTQTITDVVVNTTTWTLTFTGDTLTVDAQIGNLIDPGWANPTGKFLNIVDNGTNWVEVTRNSGIAAPIATDTFTIHGVYASDNQITTFQNPFYIIFTTGNNANSEQIIFTINNTTGLVTLDQALSSDIEANDKFKAYDIRVLIGYDWIYDEVYISPSSRCPDSMNLILGNAQGINDENWDTIKLNYDTGIYFNSNAVIFGSGGTVVYTSNKLDAFAATTSAELAGVISDETGSGLLVFGTEPTFTTNITCPLIKPAADSTTAFQVTKADGSTGVLITDTTNIRLGLGVTPSYRLDVPQGNSIGMLIGADNSADLTRTDSTTKAGRIGMIHYTNAEEPVSLIYGSSLSVATIVYIGGGTSLMNAASTVALYTALDTTTTTGFSRLEVNTKGEVSYRPHDYAGTPVVGTDRLYSFVYYKSVGDDEFITLPSVFSNGHGTVQIGDDEEFTNFRVNSTGTVTLYNNTANIVANADTDTNICIGTAAAQEPLLIKNRLGSTKAINIVFWHN